MAPRILVVDDEPEIVHYLQRGLSHEGYMVEVASTGPEALTRAREHMPDLIVLDLMLPGMDGMEVARRFRTYSANTPIIMLTARESVADRVAGLENGADDYLIKPFAFEELLARVRAQLRHHHAKSVSEVLAFGPLEMQVAAHSVRVDGHLVELTAKEFEILAFFLHHPNQVLTRNMLYMDVWGYDFGDDSNVVEVYIRALRQKLEAHGAPRLLHTVRGTGYVLRLEA